MFAKQKIITPDQLMQFFNNNLDYELNDETLTDFL